MRPVFFLRADCGRPFPVSTMTFADPMVIRPLRTPTQFIATVFLLGLAAVSQAAPLPIPAPPPLKASSYILIDFNSGQVLAQSKDDKRIEPASITKIMTAYLVFKELRAGTIKESDQVPISEKAWRMPGSRMFIEVGKRVSVDELLKGMIIDSGNDATVALAEHVAGSEEAFVALMNQEAQTLGLTGSHFANATGLPHPDHYMTARDIATLTRALIRDFPAYYKHFEGKKLVYDNISQRNRNRLLWRDPSVDGVKTGHTDAAGYCLVASGDRNGMRLISVVLGTDSDEARTRESEILLNYGFRFFETHHLYEAGQALAHARIWKGAQDQVPLGLTKDLYVTIPRGRYRQLKATMNLTTRIMAPAAKGQVLGTVDVTLGDTVEAKRPLIALQTVPEGGLVRRVMDSVRLWFQ